MAGTLPPSRRVDLIFEGLVSLDGGGSFTSPWLDTTDILSIRVGAYFLNNVGGGQGFNILEGSYDGDVVAAGSGPRVFRQQQFTATALGNVYVGSIALTGRYFQFHLTGGDPNDYCAVTIRKVG